MNCFKILDIEPTRDKNVIENAYSNLVGNYSQGNDPEYLNILMQAYREAIEIASEKDQEGESLTNDLVESDDSSLDDITSKYYYIKNVEDKSKVEEFNFLYNRINDKIDKYNLIQIRTSIDKIKELYPYNLDILILEARYFINLGKINEATKIYNFIIKERRKDIKAYLHRGELYFRLGKLYRAYDDYKKVLEFDKKSKEALFMLGKICISLEKYDKAIEYLERHKDLFHSNEDTEMLLDSAYYYRISAFKNRLDNNPNDNEARYELAKSYFTFFKLENCYDILTQDSIEKTSEMYILLYKVLTMMDKDELCLKTMNEGVKKYPEDPEINYLKGFILQKKGQNKEAIKYYEKAISLDSNNVKYYEDNARALLKVNRYKDTVECCDNGLNTKPKKPLLFKYKAEALYELKKYEESLENCDKCLNLNKNLIEPYIIKMKVYNAINDYKTTLKTYEKADKLGYNTPELFIEKGNALRNLKKYEEAIKNYNIALEMDNNNYCIYLKKALCHYEVGQYVKAIELIEKSLEINPNIEQAYYYKALCLKELSNEKEMLSAINTGIRLKGNILHKFYYLKGKHLENKNNYSKALKNYRKAIEIEPENTTYQYDIGMILKQLNKLEESKNYLNKAIEVETNKLDALIGKSHSLFCLGKLEESLELIDKACKLDPNNLIANQHKALCLYQLEKIEEAEVFCDKGLEKFPDNEQLILLKTNILYEKKEFKNGLKYANQLLKMNSASEKYNLLKNEMESRLKGKRKRKSNKEIRKTSSKN
ncbi:MAG: tetratricopeptide repeat protein [Eubacteriales bacterium]